VKNSRRTGPFLSVFLRSQSSGVDQGCFQHPRIDRNESFFSYYRMLIKYTDITPQIPSIISFKEGYFYGLVNLWSTRKASIQVIRSAIQKIIPIIKIAIHPKFLDLPDCRWVFNSSLFQEIRRHCSWPHMHLINVFLIRLNSFPLLHSIMIQFNFNLFHLQSYTVLIQFYLFMSYEGYLRHCCWFLQLLILWLILYFRDGQDWLFKLSFQLLSVEAML